MIPMGNGRSPCAAHQTATGAEKRHLVRCDQHRGLKTLMFTALQPDRTSDGPFVKESDLADLVEQRQRLTAGGGIGVGSYLLLDACGGCLYEVVDQSGRVVLGARCRVAELVNVYT
jgi:hypothetical protein